VPWDRGGRRAAALLGDEGHESAAANVEAHEPDGGAAIGRRKLGVAVEDHGAIGQGDDDATGASGLRRRVEGRDGHDVAGHARAKHAHELREVRAPCHQAQRRVGDHGPSVGNSGRAG
jgi:hypothetical protein